MNITKLIAASALALAVCTAQPATVFAGTAPPPAANAAGVVIPMAWAVTFLMCTALRSSQIQAQAAALHLPFTAADAQRATVECLIPIYGISLMMRGK